MDRRFLHHDIRSFEISRFRFITGIIIGVCYAVIFYTLLYFAREVFIRFSVTKEFDFWHFTHQEIQFYNLVFAFIAVIMGQSQCIGFWLERPRRFFDQLHRRKVTIVNDQKVLNWSFLSWFSRLAMVYGLLFGFNIKGGYYVFSFYPTCNYVFVLLILVLYFQTWNTIRQMFKNKSLKWMLIFMVIVSGFSFSLSKVNFINHKKLYKEWLHKSIYYNYNLDLPKTNVFHIDYMILTKNVYVVTSKEHPDDFNPIIIMDNKEISPDQFCSKIELWRSKMEEWNSTKAKTVRLVIDSSVRMKCINQIKRELSNCGISKIAYAVLPIKPRYDNRYYNNLSLDIYIPDFRFGIYNFKEFYQGIYNYDNIIDIKQLKTGACFVNDSLVDMADLKVVIKKDILRNEHYVLKYLVNDSINFASYLKVIISYRKALNELRNEYAIKNYGKGYNVLDSLYDPRKNEIIRRLPMRLCEFTNEITKALKSEGNH